MTEVCVIFIFESNFDQNFIEILTVDIIKQEALFNFQELTEFNYQDIIFNI